MDILISVIVPIFNAEKNLKDCIESIVSQSENRFELILVDDGSKDRSAFICDDYAKLYGNIRVVHQENSGVSMARNRGIEIACGKYIMFVDSDDCLDSNMLAEALFTIEKENADLFVCGLQEEFYNNQKIIRIAKHSINKNKIYSLKELLENFIIEYPMMAICGPWCKLYKSEIIKKNGITFDKSLSFGEDSNFNFDYLKYVKKIVFSNRIYYHYRRESSESLYSKYHPEIYENHVLVYNKMRNLMLNEKCCISSMQRFETMYCLSLVGAIIEYYQHYNLSTRGEKIRQIDKVATNQFFKKYNPLMASGLKKKLIFLLLHVKCYNILHCMFRLFYGKTK